jgi:acetylornithine deacetylase
MHLTTSEQRALEAVDGAAAVRLLTDLLVMPSMPGSDAEAEIQHVLAERMRRLGLDVDLWQIDVATAAATPGFPGMEAERSDAWGLVANSPGACSEEAALILQGHVDVVPPGDLARWSGAPFSPRTSDRRIHGRGACDMKAGVAANVAAVAAIRTAGIRTRKGYSLHSVIGEEDGGIGAFATLLRGHTGAACIITEPTSGTLITANAGALTFSIRVPGVATHGSTAYAGSNAITSYMAIHHALAELEEQRNRTVEPLMHEYRVAYPISVGRVRAGDWASSVPDLLIAEGRMGIRIDEDPAQGKLELEETVAKVSAQDPFLRDVPATVTWSGGQFAGGRLPAAHPLARRVAGAHADATQSLRPRERGAPYGSDLRLYAALGIPTLHYGPGEVRLAHGPDESVDVKEFLAVIRTLTLSLVRECGAD